MFNSLNILNWYTHIRHIVMDQKSNEQPQPAVAKVHTDNPTPISLNGLWLKKDNT